MLSDEMRAFLVSGPHPKKKKKAKVLLDLGGSAHVRVEWRRHRQELLDACPMGKRPWAFWMIERGLAHYPAGEAGELRAIRTLQCYRDEAERRYVLERLAVITAKLRSHWHRRVA